jgi:beta-xylosidase
MKTEISIGIRILCFLLLVFFVFLPACGIESLPPTLPVATGGIAPKPLYRDPIYDGAADPVVIWNRHEQKWFMFYTNRRANVPGLSGVSWVHGTPIGIAESADGGVTWTYRQDANIGYAKGNDTYWAPDVIEHDGTYHMYLTYVPGIFESWWPHPRDIIHLTSKNLLDWKYRSTLKLASDAVIDASVFRLDDGTWCIWYKNERDHSYIYHADSPDLYTWQEKGKVIGDREGEGPKIFAWKGRMWIVMDNWNGLGVYRQEDSGLWSRQPWNLLVEPGTGNDDQSMGKHPDVVVNDGRAYLFYFTHPGQKGDGSEENTTEQRRSSIQVVELEYKDGWITCDRNKPTFICLRPEAQYR